MRNDMYKLREEKNKYQDDMKKKTFGYNSIVGDKKMLIFYTGLQSFFVFNWIVKIFTKKVKIVKSDKTFNDHLLIVLMKLRLGISNKDLAFRFLLTESSVSRILREWVPVLACGMKQLIIWPSREVIRKNMPNIFTPKFSKCRCIIDCTEIFIDRTYNLKARAETWSNYKNHNTAKYLIAITPAGAISFLSEGWGGRVSDKQITVESGFISKIDHGDEVLADRGFLIRDELAAVGATLRIPGFTKGKKQMSAKDVDTSRQLSRVRIHVERVIGRWKNYKILTCVCPISQLDLLDDYVVICAALTNLSSSVVNKK